MPQHSRLEKLFIKHAPLLILVLLIGVVVMTGLTMRPSDTTAHEVKTVTSHSGCSCSGHHNH